MSPYLEEIASGILWRKGRLLLHYSNTLKLAVKYHKSSSSQGRTTDDEPPESSITRAYSHFVNKRDSHAAANFPRRNFSEGEDDLLSGRVRQYCSNCIVLDFSYALCQRLSHQVSFSLQNVGIIRLSRERQRKAAPSSDIHFRSNFLFL